MGVANHIAYVMLTLGGMASIAVVSYCIPFSDIAQYRERKNISKTHQKKNESETQVC